jgi:hypothetical protein
VVPNYSASNTVSVVFTDFTYRAILFDNNLLVLSLIHDMSFRNIPDLPSWVLDLSRVGAPTTTIHNPPSGNSGNIRLPTFLFFINRYKKPTITNQFSLRVQGMQIDQIVDHADEFHNVDGNQVLQWLKLAHQLDDSYLTHEGQRKFYGEP